MVEKNPISTLWPSLYDPLRQFGARLAEFLAPAADASSDDGAYRITMELPGVQEDDISVSVRDGVVTIKGEKKSGTEKSGDTWYFSERQYGSFSRAFRLPADADEAGIEAALNDGVLTLTVPRRKPVGEGAETRVPISRG
ncbi:Hsp20/alpha crystallin family protein [Rhodobacteraceae bacterium 2376]|uniref:Hsp20/alpha crystallin family protein n=1 Tax=Rhabdonatronobacter sediminivivens TaxID=2743469 RepID=A0A7Z0KX59_9RHOB|nr:Hsp20/alpha crystallin family protein [Rhabdonatronobacter sediminivivens]NYS24577.1 Hsp20/alpha crystallin family protein [Rhabdonatronobacter sediminivivens]